MLEGSCHCGAVRWQLDDTPESATACNCTSCRRWGALWAYGFDGLNVSVSGATSAYERGPALTYHFCARCGNVSYWRTQRADDQGRHRMGVNLRLCEPGLVAALPIDHFDGLVNWEDLPRDGRCVQDLWF